MEVVSSRIILEKKYKYKM